MGRRPKPISNTEYFFVTATFKDWKHFGDIPGFYEKLAESIIYYNSKYSAKTIGYVFMPSHIHFIVFIDGKQLGNYMRDFKKYISQKAVRDLGISDEAIWESRYDSVGLYSDNVLLTKLKYIHCNPSRSDLVENIIDWKWSSAKDYLSGTDGPLPIWKGWAG